MTAIVEQTPVEPAVQRLTAELERWRVPGAELAVVADGRPVYAGGVGVRGVDDPTAVGPDTLFHHGSCAKAYTGLLAALLAADGLLDLDAPVRHYVPELRLPDPVLAERMTTRDLLSHRSGLGRHDLAWIFNPSWSAEEVVSRLEHLPLAGDLRAQWVYSNFGYTLAGLAMGRAAASSWEVELQQRVLSPLGMHRTRLTTRGVAADADHAKPHLLREDKPVATSFRVLEGIAPAGELVSCAADSVPWLLAQLGSGVVSVEAVRAAQQPQMLVPSGALPLPELDLTGYAFGWIVGRYRDRPLIWHNGGVDGFITQTLLLPADGLGVLVSVNQHMSNLALAAVLDVADDLLGASSAEGTWYDRLRADDAPPPPAQRPPTDPHPFARALTDYAGRYRSPAYGDLHVERCGDGLEVRVGECVLDARHRSFETWELHYEPLDTDLTVTFVTDAAASVAEARVEVEDGEPPIRFLRMTEPLR